MNLDKFFADAIWTIVVWAAAIGAVVGGILVIAVQAIRHAFSVLLIVAMLCSVSNAQWHYKTYQVTPAATSASATANVKIINPNDPDWRTKALEVARERQAWQQAAIKTAADHKAYLETINALGLADAVGVPGGSLAQSAAYGGDSLYGYTYSTVADYYNQADRNVLANQAYNTASRSLDLAGKWSDNMRDLYSLEIGAQERTASIIAEGQKASEIIRAAAQLAEASKQQHTRIRTQGQVIGQGPPPAPTELSASSAAGPGQTLTQKCASCHAGVAAPKGIVLDGSQPINFRTALASIRAIDEGTMPPPEKNIEISEAEYQAIETDLGALVGR